MGRIAECQLAQRPMHIAWNRAARADLLMLLEDGSVHRMDVDHCLRHRSASAAPQPSLSAQVQAAAGLLWLLPTVRHVPIRRGGRRSESCQCEACAAMSRTSTAGESVSTVPQADVILPAEQHTRWWRPGQRMAAVFAPQPRAVLVAVGNRLLRCGEPALGAAPVAPTLMHARPAGEEITCVATLPEVRLLGRMCLVVGMKQTLGYLSLCMPDASESTATATCDACLAKCGPENVAAQVGHEHVGFTIIFRP